MAKDVKISKKRGLSFSNWESVGSGPYKMIPSLSQQISEYYLMSRYDPTVKISLATIKNIILSKKGKFTHENKDLEEKVNLFLSKTDGGVTKIISNLLSSLWAGYSVSEKVWNTNEDEWYIESMPLLHPLSFFSWRGDFGIQLDDNGDLSFTQYDDLKTPVKHEKKDIVYLALNSELEEEVSGNSLLQSARKAWYSKNYIQDFSNTFSQKLATPTPIILTPEDKQENPFNNEMESIAQIFVDLYDYSEPGNAIGIPLANPSDVKIEYLKADSNGEFYEWILKYYDAQLMMAMFVPELLIQEPEHGSRSQSETTLKVFYELLNGLRQEVGEVIENQIIQELITVNYGEMEDFGSWEWEPLQDNDLEQLSKIYRNITAGMKSIGDIENIENKFDVDLTKIKGQFEEIF